MFKPRYECDAGPFPGREMGAGTGVAQLSRAFIIDDWGYFGLRTRLAELADDYRLWCDRISLKFHALDLVPDLAEDIGSARWFRGMATMFGLAALALLLWPNAAPVEAAQPMQIDDSSRDEFRSQMIMPLAFGGDSGRHMAANGFVVPLKSAPERPRIEMVATLAQGDSFARMLQRAGVGGAEAGMVESRIASSASLADLEPGTQVDVVLGRRTAPGQPRPLDSLSFRARFDLQLSVHRSGNGFTVQPRPIHVDTTPLRIHGIVGASLYRSARAAGAPAKAVQQYLQAIDEQTDLESALGANDEYDLILSYKRAATGEVQVGDLLYAGVLHDGKPKLQLMRWGSDNRFYETSGVGEQRSGFIAPVASSGISSGYGMRWHPILGYSRMHAGIDFRASYGQPIYAVADGVVQFAGLHGGHGNFVKLAHGGGLGTGYAHMSRIAVSPGESVRRGQVIGYVGSTGLSTGPHLHYEVYRNGQTVNPMSVQFVTHAQIAGAELQNFRARLAQLLAVKPGAALGPLGPAKSEPAKPGREIARADHPQKMG